MSKELKLKRVYKNSKIKIPKWLKIIISIILVLVVITIIRVELPLFYIPHFGYEYSNERTIEPVLTGDIIIRTDLNGNEFEYRELQAGEITMMDRNLGATTYDITNASSRGYYYQWGNNYGFTLDNINVVNHKVESAEKGYYSDKFVSYNFRHEDWLLKSNDSLRGAKSNKYEDKQGPCPNGWHIPTIDEREYILENVKFDKLLIPMANSIDGDGNMFYYPLENGTKSDHEYAELWSSSKVFPGNLLYLYYLYDLPMKNSDGNNVINPDKHLSRGVGFSENITKGETIIGNRSIGLNIRCFKNK